jgi:flagellar protein FlgJ
MRADREKDVGWEGFGITVMALVFMCGCYAVFSVMTGANIAIRNGITNNSRVQRFNYSKINDLEIYSMATRKEQIEFVKAVYPAARRLQEAGEGVHPLFVTAQAALETGYKIGGIENNIFGITKGSSWTGRTALVRTTEYFSTPDKQFTPPEEIISVIQMTDNRWRYSVKRLFRVYDSLDNCLNDHLAILKKPGYADAWPYRNDPKEYARRISDSVGAQYATAPNYASLMAQVIDSVGNYVKELGL